MTRAEFLNKLEELLHDIPSEERVEALQFYQDYFDDAGVENEQAVITELGTPEQVAKLIKADIEAFSGENGEYTETGYQDERFDDRQMPVKKGYRYQQTKWSGRKMHGESVDDASKSNDGNGYHYEGASSSENAAETVSAEEKKPYTNTTLKVILIIALILVGSPLIFGVGAGAFGVIAGLLAAIVGILCGIIGLSIGLVVGAVAILISGIIIVVAGITKLFTIMPVGILTVGIGIIIAVVGLVATAATVKLCLLVYPAMIRGIINLCRKPFHRKGAAQT